jgi:hypothetical protein
MPVLAMKRRCGCVDSLARAIFKKGLVPKANGYQKYNSLSFTRSGYTVDPVFFGPAHKHVYGNIARDLYIRD